MPPLGSLSGHSTSGNITYHGYSGISVGSPELVYATTCNITNHVHSGTPLLAHPSQSHRHWQHCWPWSLGLTTAGLTQVNHITADNITRLDHLGMSSSGSTESVMPTPSLGALALRDQKKTMINPPTNSLRRLKGKTNRIHSHELIELRRHKKQTGLTTRSSQDT